MSESRVELAVEIDESRLPVSTVELTELLERSLRVCGLEGAVSLAIVDDETMRAVNRDYHECDATTDVLAFPLGDPGETPGFCAEIVLSFDTAEREAAARGVEPLAELMLYAVHGTLHLLGYDDHEPGDARIMHQRTLEVLRELGLRNDIEV